MMTIFNKLVRDKIPNKIIENGETCITRKLDKNEYLEQLNIKIVEEINEYLESGEILELADVEEVLRAILDAKGVTYDEFEKIRLDKAKKRGAFKERIFLESTSNIK